MRRERTRGGSVVDPPSTVGAILAGEGLSDERRRNGDGEYLMLSDHQPVWTWTASHTETPESTMK